MDITNRSHILHTTLQIFYKKEDNFEKLYDMYMNPKTSLRVIDWFVTNYAKKYNIIYEILIKEKKNQFNVFTSYKSQLKSYSKRYFDPFCRRQRTTIYIKDKELTTTIGQLNFFRWAISNKIIDYIYDNYDKIDKDMNISMSNHIKIKSKHVKRKELSKSSFKGLNITRNPITLYFD
jgi:hypothetical protein